MSLYCTCAIACDKYRTLNLGLLDLIAESLREAIFCTPLSLRRNNQQTADFSVEKPPTVLVGQLKVYYNLVS